jgi:hypothetical protein
MTFNADIRFSGGVPVGGWSGLTISKDGSYRFTGHLHDSGAWSYETEVVVRLRGVSGQLYELPPHKGFVNGTFNIGSRDDDWDVTGTAAWITDAWDDLEGAAAIFHAHADGGGIEWEGELEVGERKDIGPKSSNPIDAEEDAPPGHPTMPPVEEMPEGVPDEWIHHGG